MYSYHNAAARCSYRMLLSPGLPTLLPRFGYPEFKSVLRDHAHRCIHNLVVERERRRCNPPSLSKGNSNADVFEDVALSRVAALLALVM